MAMGTSGDWVLIEKTLLEPKERANHIPSDTQKVPLTMWVKGFLLEEGSLGQKVKIKTILGREIEGTLVEINPSYHHNFGEVVPEILQVGLQVRALLKDGEEDES